MSDPPQPPDEGGPPPWDPQQQPPWDAPPPPQQPWSGSPPPQQQPWGGPPAPQWGGASPQPWGKPPLASWGQRFGAVLIDGLFFIGAFVVLFLLVGLLGTVLGAVSDVLRGLVAALLMLGGYLTILIVPMLMEAGPYGQTPGKHVVGIRVVDTSGRTLTKGVAVGRWFAKILSGMPCYLGYLWPLWDEENRTFHDMLVNTRVVMATDKAPSLLALVQAPFTGRPS